MDRIELGTSNKYLMFFCNMVCNYRERRRQANQEQAKQASTPVIIIQYLASLEYRAVEITISFLDLVYRLEVSFKYELCWTSDSSSVYFAINNKRHRCYRALKFSPPSNQGKHRVLAWPYLAEKWPGKLVIDLFAQHQRFAVCCPLITSGRNGTLKFARFCQQYALVNWECL